MIKLGADGHEVFLGEHDLDHAATMHRKTLKQLRPVSDRLGMLHDHAHLASARAVRDLDPIARVARLGREVDAECRDRIAARVLVELGDEQVVVFHAQRELLHVDVVEQAVLAAEQQDRAGRVERRDGRDVLGLPQLGQRVPHADFAHQASCHEL